MDVNVRTEATVYLDSEDDEDPLRLSPPPPPALPTSHSLRSQVRQRFAQLQKNSVNQGVIHATGEKTASRTTSRRVALQAVVDAGSKQTQLIEIIDLEDDSSPNNSPKRVPSLPSAPTASSLNGAKNGTDENKHKLRNGHKVSNRIPEVSLSSKPSKPSTHEKTFTVASITRVSSVGREESDSPSRKRHRLHATNQVIAIASTSKEGSQFIPSYPSSPKKSKPSREKDFADAASDLTSIDLSSDENELPRSTGRHGLKSTNEVVEITSTSKESDLFVRISQSSTNKSSFRRGDSSPAVSLSSKSNRPSRNYSFTAVSLPTKSRPCTEASSPTVRSPTKAREPFTEENFSAVASRSKAIRPGRDENAPVALSPSKGMRREQKIPEISSSSKKVRPGREEVASTMSKLVECDASNHNIFQKFIEICVACDNSADLKAIHKKKTYRYYKNLEPEYEESEMFRLLLEENISIMAKNPAMVFTCLINVHAEMKRQRVVANGVSNHSATNSVQKCNSPVSSKKSPTLSDHQRNGDAASNGLETEEDSKEARKREKTKQHIKNLEKALRQCNLRIKKLEEAEVDWDEEDDSSYMKMQRYRRRCIDIHRKLVQLKGVRDDAIKKRTRVASACPFPDVRAAIERYVYTKSTFPDFSDVIKIYQEANIPGLRPSDVKCEAEKTFKEIGDQIQRDRQVYDWNIACAFLDNTSDPAEHDSELRLQLQHNKQLGDSKLDEVMASFTRKQYEQHLEPTEVPDELAAATDDNDDDEDDQEDKEQSDDDLQDGLVELGGDATDSDSDSNKGPPSNGSKTTQGEEPEKESENDKKKEAQKSTKTQNSESSSKSKNKSSSYAEDFNTKTTTKVLPVTVNSQTSPNRVVSKPLRTILPAVQPGEILLPAETFLSTQTLLPVQIIMPAQTPLISIGSLPPQAQPTYTSRKVMREFQLEALSNYLEMKYQIDPSAINTKSVSSSIETTTLEQPASSSGAVADSTESKSGRLCEKTGSDPEVTSTSVDLDIVHDNQAKEIGQTATGAASCETVTSNLALLSQVAADNGTGRKLLVKGDLFADNVSSRSHRASECSKTKDQVKSDDFSTKTNLANNERARVAKSKDNSHKRSFSEVHSSYVLNRQCESVDWDANDEDKPLSNNSWSDAASKELGKTENYIRLKPFASLGKKASDEAKICGRDSHGNVDVNEAGSKFENANVPTKEEFPKHVDTKQEEWDSKERSAVLEDDVFAEEVTKQEAGSTSLNEVTEDLEDWENMIVPTVVVKEVLVVPTDADEEMQGTEIETSAEIDLDSDDEYVQKSPTIKVFQKKGRDIVPTSNEPTVKIHSESSEITPSSPERNVATPSAMVMLARRSIKLPIVMERSDSVIHSASTVLDDGRGENVQEAKQTCGPTDQENVPIRKILAEKAASARVKFIPPRKPKARGSLENLKTGIDGTTAGSSLSSGLPETDVQESEEIASSARLDQVVQSSLQPSLLPDVLSCKVTARKTTSGRSFVIKTKKPSEHSEPVLKLKPVTRCYGQQNQMPQAVAAEPERKPSVPSASVSRRQLKPTARKSIVGQSTGGLHYKTWTIEKLKEETILSWGDSESSMKSTSVKVNEADIILIDSD